VSYLANVMDKLENTLEATTCESLLVDRNELLAGASQIPEGRDRCGGSFLEGRRVGQLWLLVTQALGDSRLFAQQLPTCLVLQTWTSSTSAVHLLRPWSSRTS
jgi:hypothetical protein